MHGLPLIPWQLTLWIVQKNLRIPRLFIDIFTLKCWFLKVGLIILLHFFNIASREWGLPTIAKWFWFNYSEGTPEPSKDPNGLVLSIFTLKCTLLKIDSTTFLLFSNIASLGYLPGMASWFWLNRSMGSLFACFHTKTLIISLIIFLSFFNIASMECLLAIARWFWFWLNYSVGTPGAL